MNRETLNRGLVLAGVISAVLLPATFAGAAETQPLQKAAEPMHNFHALKNVSYQAEALSDKELAGVEGEGLVNFHFNFHINNVRLCNTCTVLINPLNVR